MTDFLETDALTNTPDEGTPPIRDHPDEAVTSFIATPRIDKTLMQKIRSLFASQLTPGIHVTHKNGEGLRYMFIITSNSYLDRDDETITSEALKAYEDSCYPAEDVFHCDNPLLWWHDDDVVMGEIVAVNYSEPFLIEIAKEINTPIARVLWDYAETNGDSAGASHRFGYRDEDRSSDGTYTRIFKQESTYLPDRSLAANSGTYAGVIKQMATQHSDKRLNQIFEQATGIRDAAAKIHAKSGALEKELEALGITHKAKPAALMDEAAGLEEDALEETDGEETKAPAEMGKWVSTLNSIYALVMELVGSQEGSMAAEMALAKSIKALEDERITSKAYEQTLEQRLAMLEARLKMAPRSVQQEKGTNYESIAEAVKVAEAAKTDGELVFVPGFGNLKPAPKTGN